MAYADNFANSANRKLRIGAVVLVFEGALAWAVAAGLVFTGEREIAPRLPGVFVPLPEFTPKPPPDDKVPAPALRDPKPAPRPPIDLGPSVLPTTTFTEDLGGTSTVEFPKVDPLPIPRPVPTPAFTPRAARPKGNTAIWVTTNDYPTSALRRELSGTARYRLAIDAGGKVSGCTITASSGHPELDQATCDKLTRRAQFEPATNDTGARVAGSFGGAVTWQLPLD